MKFSQFVWLIGVLYLMTPAAVLAQSSGHRERILIDRSGSMEGFFVTGEIQKLQTVLRDISAVEGDAYYFIDTTLVPVDQNPTNFGADTYLLNALDRALAQQPAPTIVWLITDNQPSVGNQTTSDHDIAQFYERLRSDAVKRLYFFPLKLSFTGKLYREDGHQVLKANYEGKRGLLVYALLLDTSAQAEFDRVTKEFQTRAPTPDGSELQRILIKPLEQDTVTARLVGGENFRVENENQLIAGVFDEGARIKGNFKIEITSQLGQMKISKADIDVAVLEQFHTGDFTESEIKPAFSPHYIQNFEPQNKREIHVSIDAPGLHVRNNPVSWWNCLRKNRGEVNGNVQIMVKVPGQNFDVIAKLANDFSTTRDIYNDDNETVQSRIYKLDDLVRMMLPQQQVDIRPQIGTSTGNIPVRLLVRYSKRRLIVLLIALLFLLLVVLLLYRLLGRGQVFRLTWDSGRYRACPDFRLSPLFGQQILIDNRAAATIRKSFGGIRVHASKGYTVDDTKSRMVSARGTDFNVSSETLSGLTFYFSSVAATLGGAAAGQNEGQDIFGDVSYGSDGSTNLVGGSTAAPPVQKPTTAHFNTDGSQVSDVPGVSDSDSVNLDDLYP